MRRGKLSANDSGSIGWLFQLHAGTLARAGDVVEGKLLFFFPLSRRMLVPIRLLLLPGQPIGRERTFGVTFSSGVD